MDKNNEKNSVITERERYEVLITEEEIRERVRELGKQISMDYKDNGEKPLVLVGVLTGALIFLSDLAREIEHPRLRLDTVGVSSYGEGTETSRLPKITSDLKNSIYDSDVIIIEDIVDTGYSMAVLLDFLKTRKPHSIKVASFLSKPDRKEVDVSIDYLGFEIPDVFVQGYGLDCAGEGREWKNIVVKQER